jgi:hypothetical protein
MLVGAIDPLEGSFIILPGVGLVAVGALVGQSRHGTLLWWSLGLVAFGVAAMVVFTWWGGLGGNSGHSAWWAVIIVPYPVGWLMGLVGGTRSLIESWNKRTLQPKSI